MRPILRYLLAALAGVLWGLCFGREPLAVASWLAFAPLVLLMAWPRPGRLGWVAGYAYWMVSLYWIVPTLGTYGGTTPMPLAIVLTSLLAGYLALYNAVFAWLGSRIWQRFPAGVSLLVLPALWVALEWVRTYLGGGFPWNLAGYAWIDVPGALAISAWIGVYGVSFLLVFAATGLAASFQRRRWEPAAVALLLPLLLLALAGRSSLRQTAEEVREAGGFGRPVRLLQPNIPNLVDLDPVAIARNYRRLMDQSIDSCQPGSLVVWPESAAWPFLYGRDRRLDEDLEALVDRGCSVLFNTSHPVGEQFYNSALLLSAGQPEARYDKRHLVPFGEYVPFRGIFGWMDKLARNAGEFRPADRMTLLPWAGEKIGMAICYEVVFPSEVAQGVRDGATMLVTITNDAWYGDTTAPWQHFRMARFRAAENRRPLLRAAITGVSGYVAPDGSVRAQIGVYQAGVIKARVLGQKGLTPFSRWPWLVPALCSLLAVAGLVAASLFPVRSAARSQ